MLNNGLFPLIKVLISAGSIVSGRVKKVKKACDNKGSEITIEAREIRAVDGQAETRLKPQSGTE